VLLRSVGPLGAVLGLVGLVISFARCWRSGLVLLLAFVPQAMLGASYLLESHYEIPRHWVFFLPGFLIWAVWLALGLDTALRWLGPRLPGHRAVLLGAVVILVAGVQAGTAWARPAVVLVRSEAGAETLDDWRQDLQRSPLAERYGRLAFAAAAPNGIIVCDWEQATILWYLQRVEGQRPDLTIRYPIERLDGTLTEARTTGQTVYISRTLPGVESKSVTSSVGPLLQVAPPPAVAALAATTPAAPSASVPTVPAPSVSPSPEAASISSSTASSLAVPIATRFEGGLVLAMVSQHDRSLRPGSVLSLTLRWQAERPLTEAYAVAVRLIGPNGAILAVHDERHPALGTSPTNTWTPGQTIGDYHELPLGSRLAPGTYQLQVQPYRVDPLTNLRRLDAAGQPGEEGVSLPIEVGPRVIAGPLDLLGALLAR
jgi:hypothetical protein